MLVGSSGDTEAVETTPPTASIETGASVSDAGELETAAEKNPVKESTPKSNVVVNSKEDDSKAAKKVEPPVVKKQPVVVAKKPWWDVCLGKKCAVDFGGIKTGLSIRRGTIDHNQKVDWNLRFKKAQRLNILPTDRRVKVELVAVGFDGKGKPAVAQVNWSDKGRAVSGVISLQPGDKRVRLLANTAE